MTDTVLQKTIFLKAPRQLVWDYLTQPEHLAKWFHAPKTPLAEGQKLEMFGTTSGDLLIWGKVIRADAPSHLEYTFTVGPMGDAVSTVKWTLTDVPGGTQLSLVHDGLPQGEAAFGLTLALDKGWDDHLMRMRNDIHGED
ncbi:MAG: SRPBCC domain-containing protein [Pseudomonadota bacterium]